VTANPIPTVSTTVPNKCEACGASDVALRWIFGGGDEDEPGNWALQCEKCSSPAKWAEAKEA
jgi:hypothetical protein